MNQRVVVVVSPGGESWGAGDTEKTIYKQSLAEALRTASPGSEIWVRSADVTANLLPVGHACLVRVFHPSGSSRVLPLTTNEIRGSELIHRGE